MSVNQTGKIEDVSNVTTSELAMAINALIDRLDEQKNSSELFEEALVTILSEQREGFQKIKGEFEGQSEERGTSHLNLVAGQKNITDIVIANNENSMVIGKDVKEIKETHSELFKTVLVKINTVYAQLQSMYAGRP